MQLKDVADRNHISEKYLEQIFAALRKAELIKSIKGPQGGYYLSREVGQILVEEIVFALDGTYLLADETVEPGEGGEAQAHAIQTGIIDPINQQLSHFWSCLTLKDLVTSAQEYEESAQNMYYI